MISPIYKDLTALNTFRISSKASRFFTISNLEDITAFSGSEYSKVERFILGGGSNLVLSEDIEIPVLHSSINSIEVFKEDVNYTYLKVGSGVVWDALIEYAVSNNWGGLENMSDIPGSVGASPVQNVGAYGVEAKDCITKVEGFNIDTKEKIILQNDECEFGYRNSIFKTAPFRNNVFITYVHFRLTKKHTLTTHYGNIEQELDKYKTPDIKAIREIVIKTRRSKLPSVDEIGSAGSFFKNPIVNIEIADNLKEQYAEMPYYKTSTNLVKLSAAWLIDKSGLKGIRMNDVGTYPTQALVIVNYGSASGKEVKELAAHIQKTVKSKFDIKLEPEALFV